MKNTQKKNKLDMKNLVLTCLSIVVLTLAAVYFVNRGESLITDKPLEMPVLVDTSEYVNLSPPTEQDNIDVNNTKTEIEKDDQQSETKVEPTSNATIVITYAGQGSGYVEISSYVQNVFEDGGECSLLINSGSENYSAKSTGIMDAKYTVCPTFSIPESELSAGKWSGAISYKSNKYSGTSETINIEVVR